MENFLLIHEAIVVALISQPIRKASFETIAQFITKRNLYQLKENERTLEEQVKKCSILNDYRHLFVEIEDGYLTLKDNYANISMNTAEVLHYYLDYQKSVFNPPVKALSFVDIEFKETKKIKLSPDSIVCIIAKDLNWKPTGNKKFIYYRETNVKNETVIRVYTIQRGLAKLINLLDPQQNYLAIISDSIAVNVAYFYRIDNSELKSVLPQKEIPTLKKIEFSDSKTAKDNRKDFELIQNRFIDYISA